LLPAVERCTEIPHRQQNNDALILWKLQPHAKITYSSGGIKGSAEADDAGMWSVAQNVEGRVCSTLDKLKRP
jgi:hypothetical protein